MKTLTHIELAKIYGRRRDHVKRSIDRAGVFKTILHEVNHLGQIVEIYQVWDNEDIHKIFNGFSRGSIEHGALCAIEQIKDIKLERQYSVKRPCGNHYRIDGYDPVNNIAYEVDEQHHDYQQEEDYEREHFIRGVLGCEFVRIKA